MSIKDNEKGFTLIEGLITVIILLVVTALSIPTYLQWHQNARYKGGSKRHSFYLERSEVKGYINKPAAQGRI